MLDSIAPVSSLLEQISHDSDRLLIDDFKLAASTAAELIGNTSAQISKLRREKVESSINKKLLPLDKEDGDFLNMATNLFGPNFSKWTKEHLDQMKSLQAATFPTWNQTSQSTYKLGLVFRRGHPSGKGQARGRGRGPTFKRNTQGREIPISNSRITHDCSAKNAIQNIQLTCKAIAAKGILPLQKQSVDWHIS